MENPQLFKVRTHNQLIFDVSTEITLRDLFAIALIHGFAVNPNMGSQDWGSMPEALYEMADDMIKARGEGR